jgi:3-deoxy-D-manno-octulosonic-acid transferase/heptosyltransferase-1
MPVRNPQNILIVKLSAIGDVIHTLPALNAIRKHYPNARITWLAEEAAYPLVANHPAIDRVLLSQRKRWLNDLKSPHSRNQAMRKISEFIRNLRDTEYDVILDFQALLKSGVLIALARGTRKIGFGKGMEHDEHSYMFLNERVPPVSMELHAILRYLHLLRALGIDSDEIEYKLPIQNKDRENAKALLKQSGLENASRLIAINPMAKWDTKLWENEKFAILADRLNEMYPAGIFFTGAPEDIPVIEDILSRMKTDAGNFAGKTKLIELAALYEIADVLITTDTGPMHLGAAVNVPVIALFGPTAHWRTGPFGAGHQVIRAACSPCFRRQCPDMRCMKQITPDQVLSAVKKVIS